MTTANKPRSNKLDDSNHLPMKIGGYWNGISVIPLSTCLVGAAFRGILRSFYAYRLMVTLAQVDARARRTRCAPRWCTARVVFLIDALVASLGVAIMLLIPVIVAFCTGPGSLSNFLPIANLLISWAIFHRGTSSPMSIPVNSTKIPPPDITTYRVRMTHPSPRS